MRLGIFAFAVVSIFAIATEVRAASPAQVKQLLSTQQCVGCNLRNAQ
ncbi:hypothetical protein [Dendronalium sp. ChiSLP03b]|nr:hypothetical protein [Dendronalium sp. ChiSLP03b]MDZ8208830.1 hypothetical protein [Dendronalium sp. ChiSLP03b]